MKIGIVNDMAMATEILRRVVIGIEGCQVAWTAENGEAAVSRCVADRPDLVLMDLVMPVANGVEATRRIMARAPCPILIVTASVTGNSDLVYEALGQGALDVVATPSLGAGGGMGGADALIRKIGQVGLMTGTRPRYGVPERSSTAGTSSHEQVPLLAIGSSTGGPNALAAILKVLPAGFPAGVVIVQHVDEQFARGLADWLGKSSKLAVQLAGRRQTPKSGNVYVAATNDHLTLTSSATFAYSEHPREASYRPSVDVFFHSVAQHWRQPLVGVLLTGMGRDGAEGLLALRNAGHATIAQDKRTSVVYGMPKAAAELEAAKEILPITEIGPAVIRRLRHPG